MKVFIYKVGDRKVAVAAENTTVAKHGLSQRYPGVSTLYLDVVDEIIQVNGNLTIDQQLTEIQQPTAD
jgi:hypothetical protein